LFADDRKARGDVCSVNWICV